MTATLESSKTKILANMQKKHKKIFIIISFTVTCVLLSVGIVGISRWLGNLRRSETAVSQVITSTSNKIAQKERPIVMTLDDNIRKAFLAEYQNEMDDESDYEQLTPVPGSDSEAETMLKNISLNASLLAIEPAKINVSGGKKLAVRSEIPKEVIQPKPSKNGKSNGTKQQSITPFLSAGIISQGQDQGQGNRSFLHAMLQMLYRCPDFRLALNGFLSQVPSDSEHKEMAQDLNKAFETLDTVSAAGLNGAAEFDFSNDENLPELNALGIKYEDMSKFIMDNSFHEMSLRKAEPIFRSNFKSNFGYKLKCKKSKNIKPIIRHFKAMTAKQSNGVNIKSAIPKNFKSGNAEDPTLLLENYQSFLNFDAFTLNESVIHDGEVTTLQPTRILDLSFPSQEESDIKMEELIALRYSLAEENILNGEEVVAKKYTKINAPLPANLIVNVRRSILNENESETKNNSSIKNCGSISLKSHLNDPADSPNSTYNLVSFIVRIEDHHSIVVKGPSNTWYTIRDDVTTQLRKDELTKFAQKGYLFMYKNGKQ